MGEAGSSRPPRLLVMASTYPRWPEDPEPSFVHELARRLADAFQVTVLCPHANGAARSEVMEGVQVVRYKYAPEWAETLVNDGGMVSNLRRARWKWLLVPGFLAAQTLQAWRTIRQLRPDVVHAHWLVPQGVAAVIARDGARLDPALVVTSHGADLFALRGRVFAAIKRWVASRAAVVTVVSKAMRTELHAIGVPARIDVAPMGVDLASRFTPDPAVERAEDQILFVGRLVEKKGLRHLIAAMPSILKERPRASLVVAGFGPEEADRRDQVRALGLEAHVRFLGAVPQHSLPELYRRASVFVAPFVEAASGDREGLGLVLVEAAGCGCPVVVSDLPAVHDVFDADDAYFAAPADSADLGRAVLAALAEPRRNNRSLELASRLRSRFDWGVVADRYRALLQEAMTGPGR